MCKKSTIDTRGSDFFFACCDGKNRFFSPYHRNLVYLLFAKQRPIPIDVHVQREQSGNFSFAFHWKQLSRNYFEISAYSYANGMVYAVCVRVCVCAAHAVLQSVYSSIYLFIYVLFVNNLIVSSLIIKFSSELWTCSRVHEKCERFGIQKLLLHR